MEQPKAGQGGFSFTPEQVQQVLHSPEGKQLLQLLNRDGGATLRQAAASARAGDYQTVQKLMEPLVQKPEAAALLNRLNRK